MKRCSERPGTERKASMGGSRTASVVGVCEEAWIGPVAKIMDVPVDGSAEFSEGDVVRVVDKVEDDE